MKQEADLRIFTQLNKKPKKTSALLSQKKINDPEQDS